MAGPGKIHRLFWAIVPIVCGFAAGVRADEALHEAVDRLVEAKLAGKFAAPATDAEVFRRLKLDLHGYVPTADEARAYLDDVSPYKYERAVDRLLAAPEFARRMQVVFDLMLMERRADKNVPAKDWRAWLREQFLANRPYNAIVADMLSTDGSDPKLRPAAKFVLDRDADPNVLTRDVGRLFLGRDMTCAQCHDHPLVEDYKQAHYYGLLAYFGRTYAVADGSGTTTLAEKADGDVTFSSVFKKKITHKTAPRLLDAAEVADPAITKGQEYIVPPADKVRAVPRYSRRAQLAPQLTGGRSPDFARNIVNRLWAVMMGRGLVHPLDMANADNPPSHPELLELLARRFSATGYDVRAFLRELALTRTYRRSSEPPPGLSAEDLAPERYAVAPLKPMTAEQVGWSLMQVCGFAGNTRAEIEARLLGADPKLRAIVALDPKRKALGEQLVEQAVYERLESVLPTFTAWFGGVAGQAQERVEPTVHQALFLANNEMIQGWVDMTADRAGRASANDPGRAVEELYLSVLSRRPTTEERAEGVSLLASMGENRSKGLIELAWALMTSSEFRYNH